MNVYVAVLHARVCLLNYTLIILSFKDSMMKIHFEIKRIANIKVFTQNDFDQT